MSTKASALSEPKDEAELLGRAHGLAGISVGELAERLDAPLPADLVRSKGWLGELIEAALGATAGNRPGPDFELLGIELKTLPIGRDRSPTESTFVCAAALEALGRLAWEDSPVRRKLARVLWIPVEADPLLPLVVRRIERPFLWSPTSADEEILRQDWSTLAVHARAADPAPIGAKIGRYLQLRPKAPDSRAQTYLRGFYLRRSFTRALYAAHRE